MRDKDALIKDYLSDKITLSDLTVDELDAIIDDLVTLAESYLDTEYHDAGVAMLEVLDQAIDFRSQDLDAGFEEAITAAEQRGSTYWEFENPSIH